MCWTHVWMRDGILPLNREGLETTSTIKTWVSQMGQAALLFSSEKLLMAPPSKCHLHCFPHWVRFNCLVLLDNPWHGTERSLSGCPFTFCKLRMPSATARALMILALSTSLKLSSVCQEQSWGHWGGQGAQRVAGDTSAPREMLMPEQQEAQWGGDRPAQGMPGPVLQPLTARCVQVHVPALSHLVWQPQMPTKCQQQCALGHLTVFKLLCVPEHVCWWQPVLQCLGTGARRPIWRQEHHGDPQHAGWPYLPQQAKYPPSKSSHSAPQEQCKGCSFWHFWQHWSEVRGKKSTREEG